MVMIVWKLDLQLPVQSVPITTKVVSLNPHHGKVYSMQYYMIRFVSDLRQVGCFLWVLRFPPPIKLAPMIYNWNIVESGVNTLNLNPFSKCILQVLWQKEREKKQIQCLQSFVDLGCGNGLLVHILSSEGVGLVYW